MSLPVGVVGVGSMGAHHARIYAEHPSVDLVGITDPDTESARAVAAERDTSVLSLEELLDRAEAISVATPTSHHASVAWKALGEDVNVLVEKPFVDDVEQGRQLIERANERGLVLQVGHVERFNPAVTVLGSVLEDDEIVSLDAKRLGPPIDRTMDNSVVLDLMIHDIDVGLSLVDGAVTSVTATRANGFPYVTAGLTFEADTVATLTASRISQRRVRTLSVTTPDYVVEVDYLRRSIQIYRQSVPEYVERDGDIRYRNETVVEQPVVDNGEPLKAELVAFVEAVEDGETPVVTGEDGLRALEVARRIDERAVADQPQVVDTR